MKTSNIRRRIEALEKGLSRVVGEPTLLLMPDGSTVTITGDGDYLLRLLGVAFGGENISSEQAAHLELIGKCSDSKEPGGGQLVELIRCFLLGPVETGARGKGSR